MGKVIDLDSKRKPTPETVHLFRLSAEFDAVITDALKRGLDIKSIAGTMAHRLGNLVRHVDHKRELWNMCLRIISKLVPFVGEKK